MKQLSHIVWTEGMHLAQHHFQAQRRFFEDVLEFAVGGLFVRPYGLLACELDAEALRNDIVSVVDARGLMPDGLAFDIPASDIPPAALPIRDRFSPTADSHLVLLQIPAFRADRPNVANGASANGATPARYTSHDVVVRDDVTGRDERPLAVGRKNFRLVLDADADASTDGSIVLPIARVRRDGAGHFAYDPDYVAPSLIIGASPRLMVLLHRLVEILDARADAIARGRRGSADEFAQREVASFWLLHAIQSSVPTLRHYAQIRRIHPERLYVELARLAGALCTFALDAHPRTLPTYDHDHPDLCFDALDRHIRAHLDIVVPTAPGAIRLVESEPSVYSADVGDQRAFGPARWILGVRSSLTARDLLARMSGFGTVCSRKFVLEVVRRGFPGLSLDHLPYPPATLKPRTDTQYFAIDRSGPCWDTIVSTRQVGIHVAGAIPDLELDLCILPEGES